MAQYQDKMDDGYHFTSLMFVGMYFCCKRDKCPTQIRDATKQLPVECYSASPQSSKVFSMVRIKTNFPREKLTSSKMFVYNPDY